MNEHTNDARTSRHILAREAAEELLYELETQDIDIDKSLMKAKRLARLLRDQDALIWLGFEITGYPNNFDFKLLGTCLI